MEPPTVGSEGVGDTPLNAVPFSVVIADPFQPDCPLVFVNRAFTETTGYDPQAALGRNCRFLQGADTDPEVRRKIREALANVEKVTVDIKNYRADGSPFINRLLIAPLFDADGDLTYFLGVQAERELETDDERRLRELDTKIIEIQHRVKNHLSMILSLIRLEARGRDAAGMAAVLTRRVSALTLLYEVFATSPDASRSEVVNFDAYLSRVCSVMHQLDGRSDISLNMAFTHVEAPLEIASRAGLILSEVLTNALQHAFRPEDQGSISVDFTHADGMACLRVIDDGRGMVDGTWPGEGSLGARIVQSLVEQLEGELTVDTRAGEGTTVTLRFPI